MSTIEDWIGDGDVATVSSVIGIDPRGCTNPALFFPRPFPKGQSATTHSAIELMRSSGYDIDLSLPTFQAIRSMILMLTKSGSTAFLKCSGLKLPRPLDHFLHGRHYRKDMPYVTLLLKWFWDAEFRGVFGNSFNTMLCYASVHDKAYPGDFNSQTRLEALYDARRTSVERLGSEKSSRFEDPTRMLRILSLMTTMDPDRFNDIVVAVVKEVQKEDFDEQYVRSLNA